MFAKNACIQKIEVMQATNPPDMNGDATASNKGGLSHYYGAPGKDPRGRMCATTPPCMMAAPTRVTFMI